MYYADVFFRLFLYFIPDIDAVSDSEKTWTPYGLRFKWDLTGPNKMKFYIHLKDSAKVQNKRSRIYIYDQVIVQTFN